MSAKDLITRIIAHFPKTLNPPDQMPLIPPHGQFFEAIPCNAVIGREDLAKTTNGWILATPNNLRDP
jgi:hypothetical protein